MALHLFISFWMTSLLFVITPGVDWAYAMSAGMWKRAVMPAVTGLLLGHLIATLVVAAGVGAVVAENPVALTLLTVAGALYLLWLGISMVKHPSVPVAGTVVSTSPWFTWLVKGVCVSGMNPKVFLLFLALLPQFIDPASTWPAPLQIFALGSLHILSCGMVYLLVGFGSGRVLQTRPRAARYVSQISGIVMCVIAVLLLTESFL